MKMNEIYEAPALEILNVAVEAGFEASAIEPDVPQGGDGGTGGF